MFRKKIPKVIAMSMALVLVMPMSAFATPIDLSNSSESASIDDLNRNDGTDYFADEDSNVWQNGEITEETRVTVQRTSNFEVTIPKEVILNGNTGGANYKVKAKGDIAGDQTLTVVPDDEFILSSAGKNDVNVTIKQPDFIYDYVDLLDNGTEYNGNISTTLSAGEWLGRFNFYINLNGNEDNIFTLTYTTINDETLTVYASTTTELKQYTNNNSELKNATLSLDENASKQDFSELFANNENLETVDLTGVKVNQMGNTSTTFSNSNNLSTIKFEYNGLIEDISDKFNISKDIVYLKSFNDYTWAEISNISEAGEAANYFNIGDEKELVIGSYSYYDKSNLQTIYVPKRTYHVQIIGFNHDTKTTGGKAGITVCLKEGMYTGQCMNSITSNYPYGDNVGGWEDSEMRTYLKNNVYNLLSSDVKSVIKTVNKKSDIGNKNKTSLTYTADKLFLLSCEEVGIEPSIIPFVTGQGYRYKFFTDDTSRIKYNFGTEEDGTGDSWWLRTTTTNNDSDFFSVYPSGTYSHNSASIYQFSIVFAFCI